MPKSPHPSVIKRILARLPALPGGLRARLMLLVLLSFVPTVALFSYVAWEERRYGAVAAEEEALRLVRLGAAQQQELLAQTRNLLANAIEIFAAQGPERTARCQSFVSSLIKPFPYYVNMGVADVHGNVFCSAAPMKQQISVRDRPYFREAMARPGFAFSDFQIGRITGKPTLVVAHRLRNSGREPGGIVFVALDLSWLNKLLVAVNMPGGAAITVIDSKGTVFAHHPDGASLVGKHFPDVPLVRALLERPAEGKLSTTGLDGVQKLYAHATLLDTGTNRIYITLGIPEDTVYAPVRMMLIRNIVILSVIALLVFAVAWWGSDVFVLRHTRALTDAANRLRRGEPGARTRLPHDRTELGQLALTFDTMAADLERRQKETEQTNTKLAHVNRALKTLSAGNHTLLHATDEQGLLDSMCRAIVDAGGYHMAMVFYRYDDEPRTLRPMAEAGYPGGLDALRALKMTWADDEHGRGAAAAAIRSGRTSVARNMLTDPGYAPWRANLHGSASGAACPLRVNGEVIGALVVYSAEADAFGPDETKLLGESADDLAFGIATLRARAEQQKTREALHRLSHYDALTGLPNETQFSQSLAAAIDAGEPLNQPFALVQINIERLREINDALGFSHGDQLLQKFGERLRTAAPEPTVAARLRGDEFALLLPGADASAAIATVRHLEMVLARPFLIADIPLNVTSKIGIALYPEHGSTPHDLFRHMDMALQQARKKGVGHAIFDSAHSHDQPRRLAMAGELRHAIEGGDLLLYLQPKVEIASGRVRGAEGLVRWKHAGHGLIPPGEFIALAEHTGLIKPLTEWVIEAALRLNRTWLREGCALPIAVNLSARNLREEDLLDNIRRLQTACDAGPGLLELEITESAVMDDAEFALRVLHSLRDEGIPLYIDDFGTGYSSLSYLRKLPVQYIKIDQSFVRDMATSKDSLAIVRSTIDLVHDLGLKVVAEGVETREAWNQLAALGCDIAQGYFLAKPMPSGELQKWISEFRPPAAAPPGKN
jgi:diguanylate cyclase (GGDEF)-like protein